MSRTRPYPSDLSEAEWALLELLLESPERRGRPPKWPTRRVTDAVIAELCFRETRAAEYSFRDLEAVT